MIVLRSMFCLLTMIAALTAFAATETVDGIEWTYTVSNDKASVGGSSSSLAISRSTSGAITIPSTLGGKPVVSIGRYAFSSCSGLTSVTIPNSVSSIGEGAFYYCSGLASVTIPSGVTSIGDSAFRDCNGLTSVMIPDSVASIGRYAFSFCSGLKSFVVASGNSNYKVDFGLLLTKDGKKLVVVPGGLTSVTIPNSVMSIADYAFEGCYGLTSVTIPNSVTSIGNCAFHGCSGLTSVTISDSVTSIGGGAFDETPFWDNQPDGLVVLGNCAYVVKGTCPSEVTIPDGVTSIGRSAFSGCRGLANVTIPNSVTSIGDEAFYGCLRLASVNIPDGVTYIGNGTFRTCASLRNIVIPNGVTRIGNFAFQGCVSLANIVMPNSVMSIGYGAFDYCVKLIGVCITDLEAWCKISFEDNCANPICYAHNLYLNGSLVRDLVIPDGVASIGAYAFSGCSSIASVTIPDSVTSIGDGAFSGCSSIASVTIPDSVTSIGDGAFHGCSGLTSVTIPQYICSSGLSTVFPDAYQSINQSITNVIISDSVTSIGSFAFFSCTNLMSVTIPSSVTSIGDYAFYKCSGLTCVTIPSSVTSVGRRVFSGCSGLSSITISNNVNVDVFDGCTNVTHLVAPFIPGGIDSVKLTSVTIPEGVKSVGSFYGCGVLTNVVIPVGVTSILDGAFSHCVNLTSVTIPDSVTSIGRHAFYGCSSLTGVTIPNGVTTIESGAFEECGALTRMAIPDSVTSIRREAFLSCSNLTSVTIGIGVTNIEYLAFWNCRYLASVHISDVAAWCRISFASSSGTNPLYYARKLFLNDILVNDLVIPDGVTSIGDYAFHRYSGLTSVTIPDSVTSIGRSAFSWCSGLTDVVMGDCVTNIGYRAFSCCRLTSIVIPESVMHIDDEAFYGCDWLTRVIFFGNAPTIGASCFSYVASSCAAYVNKSSTGWGVDIPGDWNGIRIEYVDEEKEEYTIVFNALVDGVEIAPRTRLYGEPLGELPVIESERYGYTFGGWENVYEETIVTSNMTISAVWNRNVYTVSFDAHTADVVIDDHERSHEQAFGDLPQPIWNGHVFLGWYTDELGGKQIEETDKVMDDIVLHAHWAEGLFDIEVSGAQFSYQTYNGVATIISATAIETSLIIPETLGDATVAEIPAACFAQVANLKRVTIPGSVTNIGAYAFYNCTNLEEVVFCEGLEKIGSGAFANCAKLKRVSLPATLVSLGERQASAKVSYGIDDEYRHFVLYADGFLANGTNFVASTIGLEELHDGDYSFEETNTGDCTTQTESHSTNETFWAKSSFCGESGGYAFSCDWSYDWSRSEQFDRYRNDQVVLTSTSVVSNEELTVAVNGVDCAMGVFEGCSALESVSLNSGLREIGAGAFKDCILLSRLAVPDSVVSIGGHSERIERAYSITESNTYDRLLVNGVEQVLIGKHLVASNENCSSEFECSGFLQGCPSLVEITLPVALAYLGPYSFAGCTSLTAIELPDSLHTINEGTFSGCSALETVKLPGSLDLIGGYEFMSSSNMECAVTTVMSIGGRPATLEANVEISTTYDADGGKCVSTTARTAAKTSRLVTYEKTAITRNDNGTFNVEEITAAGNKTNTVSYVAEYTDIDYDNRWQDGVDTVFVPNTIGDSVESEGYDCRCELKDFINAKYSEMAGDQMSVRRRLCPSAPTYNGKTFVPESGVFSGCVNLKAVVLPNTLRRIADYAFYGCCSLDVVNFPDSLEVVGYKAFGGKSAVTAGVDVGEKGTVAESGGGYVVEAKAGETLTEADFSFGVAKEAYVVNIAAGGKSATVVLKSPEVRRLEDKPPYQGGEIEEDVGEDAEDSSGVLASVEDVVTKHGESAIKAKPTPKSGETVGALPVKTYEGLYYQAAWGDDLGTMTQGEKVQATGDTLYLGVIKQKGNKGFYKITVSEQ